jgi:hypothetical protein
MVAGSDFQQVVSSIVTGRKQPCTIPPWNLLPEGEDSLSFVFKGSFPVILDFRETPNRRRICDDAQP